MDRCLAALKVYIEEKNSQYAIMIDGSWGCGKTYFVKNILKDKLGGKVDIIYISLFNINTIEDLRASIDLNLLNIYATKKSQAKAHKDYKIHKKDTFIYDSTCKAMSIKNLISTALKGVSIASSGNPLMQLLPLSLDRMLNNSMEIDGILSNFSDVLLIFDDFERSHISKRELLGFFDNLTEHKNAKVLVVCNEARMFNNSIYGDVEDAIGSEKDTETSNADSEDSINYKKYKEKVFNLTIKYQPDFSNSYDSLLDCLEKIDDRVKACSKIFKEESFKNMTIKCFAMTNCLNLRTLNIIFKRISEVNSIVNSYKKEIYKKFIDKNHTNEKLDVVMNALFLNFCKNIVCSEISIRNFNIKPNLKDNNEIMLYWNNNGYGKPVLSIQFDSRVTVHRAIEEYISDYVVNKVLFIEHFENLLKAYDADLDTTIHDIQQIMFLESNEAKIRFENTIHNINNNKYNINIYPRVLNYLILLDTVYSTNYFPKVIDTIDANCMNNYDEYSYRYWQLEVINDLRYRDMMEKIKTKLVEKKNEAIINSRISFSRTYEHFMDKLSKYLNEDDGYFMKQQCILSKIPIKDLYQQIILMDNKKLNSFNNILLNFYVDNSSNTANYRKDLDYIIDLSKQITKYQHSDKVNDSLREFHLGRLKETFDKIIDSMEYYSEADNQD